MNKLPVAGTLFIIMGQSYRNSHQNCNTCSTQNCFISLYCSDYQQDQIAEHKRNLRYGHGDYIIDEGGAFSGIYFIQSGKVKVYQESHTGCTKIIRLASDGDIVGHRGLGGNWTYSISASALGDVKLCFLPTDVFTQLLEESVMLSYHLMLFYADELRKTEKRWRLMTNLMAKGKVAFALLSISDAFLKTRKDGTVLDLPLTRQEIGELAELSSAQVSREISMLVKEGFISRGHNRKDIVIDDYLGLFSLVVRPKSSLSN